MLKQVKGVCSLCAFTGRGNVKPTHLADGKLLCTEHAQFYKGVKQIAN